MVIGLTGRMGSGKSTVSQMLTDMGLTVVCADKIVNDLYRTDMNVKRAIREEFGNYVFDDKDIVDKSKLSNIVLNDNEAMNKLNSIVHPFVHVALWHENNSEYATNPLIYDSPLLIETGKYKDMDKVILIAVRNDQILFDRIRARSGLNDDDIQSILSRQMTYEEAKPYADYVILNDGDINKLEKAVKIIMELIKNEYKSSNISR